VFVLARAGGDLTDRLISSWFRRKSVCRQWRKWPEVSNMKSWIEFGASQRGLKPWNTKAKESKELRAVTRRRPMKTQ
jgi:hypothetical protein